MKLWAKLAFMAFTLTFSACNSCQKNGSVASDSNVSKEKGKLMKELNLKENDKLYAIFKTSKGDLAVELHWEEAPKTVSNFVGLAKGTKEWKHPKTGEKATKPLYNGTIFHRVIPDFMIQGGDPMGNGMGGPGFQFEDEFHPSLRHTGPGILSMANSGPNTNGSQFFITETATPHLDNRHSVFGKVVKNLDLISQIARVERDMRDKPKSDVVLEEIIITKDLD